VASLTHSKYAFHVLGPGLAVEPKYENIINSYITLIHLQYNYYLIQMTVFAFNVVFTYYFFCHIKASASNNLVTDEKNILYDQEVVIYLL